MNHLVDAAPLHPNQVVHKTLVAVHNNDPAFTFLEFIDEQVDLLSLAIALERNTNVTRLILRGLQWDELPSSQRGFGQHLLVNGTLQVVELVRNDMGREGVRLIARALKDHTSIATLHLTGCRLLDAGVELLSQHRLGQLQHLNVRLNFLTASSGRSLRKILANNPQLKRLNVARNRLGPRGIADMLSGAGFGSLEEIDLSSSHACHESTADSDAIAQALALPGCGLRTLDLSCNSVDDEDVINLSRGMQRNQSLRILSLGRNEISNAGAQVIASTLPDRACPIERLDLHRNPIGRDGVCRILQDAGPNLESLSISSNLASWNGARAIARTMEMHNFWIKSIKYRGRKPKPDMIRVADFWVRANRAGRRLLQSDDGGTHDVHSVPLALWGTIVSRVRDDPSLLYYFLRHKVLLSYAPPQS